MIIIIILSYYRPIRMFGNRRSKSGKHMRAKITIGCIWLGVMLELVSPSLQADMADGDVYQLILRDGRFQPSNVEIPAGKRIKLIVENQDAMPAEFESFELNREKVVVPHGKVIIYIGPLDPGHYPFFDDFHREAKGVVTAR